MNDNLVRYFSIDNRDVKGVVLTAESLLDLRRNANKELSHNPERLAGYMELWRFLDSCYDKI